MNPYEDIINRPHPVSKTRRRMSAQERAAQFAPYAALTGFGAVITETARTTEPRRELDEGAREELNARLRALSERLDERPSVAVTFFLPDERKDGGAYIAVFGQAKKIDLYERELVFTDGNAIALDDIYALNGELFDGI